MDSKIKEPLVTVVTVTYNLIKNQRKDTFVEALQSVKNQSYPNIEHIVVDGASDDGTVELIEEYAEKGFVKFISEPDSGLYDAMNKGANLAKGKYILFLNSDDYLSGKDGIKKAIDLLEKSKYDFTYAKAKVIDKDNNRLTSYLHNNPDFSKIFTEMPFCHQTMVIGTELFKKLGMYDIGYKSAGDYDFVQKLVFNKYKHAFIPYEFVTYRTDGISNSNQELSIEETVQIYYKNYNCYCSISLDECKELYSSKVIPMPLLLKLIKNTNLGFIANLKLLFKYSRRKIIRTRFSLKGSSLIIFGKKII